jgi:hypothetical protein
MVYMYVLLIWKYITDKLSNEYNFWILKSPYICQKKQQQKKQHLGRFYIDMTLDI